MHFASGINRPPYETADGYLQTTEGCSHNTCLFCTLCKSPYLLPLFLRATILPCSLPDGADPNWRHQARQKPLFL